MNESTGYLANLGMRLVIYTIVASTVSKLAEDKNIEHKMISDVLIISDFKSLDLPHFRAEIMTALEPNLSFGHEFAAEHIDTILNDKNNIIHNMVAFPLMRILYADEEITPLNNTPKP